MMTITVLLQTTVDIGSKVGSFFKITDIGSLLSGVLTAVLVAASIGFILYFIWGAINWLTTGGDKTQLEMARQRITNAFIGLVLVAAAWAIYLLVIYVLGLGDIIQTAGGFANGGNGTPPAGYCFCGGTGGCVTAGTKGPRSLSNPQCYVCQSDGGWIIENPSDNSCTSPITCGPCP
jgi:hypothetical protein